VALYRRPTLLIHSALCLPVRASAYLGRRVIVPAWSQFVSGRLSAISLRQKFSELRRGHEELLRLLREAQAIVREARQESEQRLAALYREHDIQRARRAEHDPNMRLN